MASTGIITYFATIATALHLLHIHCVKQPTTYLQTKVSVHHLQTQDKHNLPL